MEHEPELYKPFADGRKQLPSAREPFMVKSESSYLIERDELLRLLDIPASGRDTRVQMLVNDAGDLEIVVWKTEADR